MKSPLVAILTLSLVLAGCGGFGSSRLNPLNWFGKSRADVATLAPEGGYGVSASDRRVLVDQVTSLEIRRTPEGAIISAAGLPRTQGWWDAELVAENNGLPVGGTMTYRFVVGEPVPGTAVASRVLTPQSREVTAGAFLSNIALQDVRRIVVTGAGNSMSVSR
ncbi:MAG: hypothetical protein K0B16_05605 [Burkholderiaceae bacterium]|nr:hypothetical protein [Burkholderiaceae bacterium]